MHRFLRTSPLLLALLLSGCATTEAVYNVDAPHLPQPGQPAAVATPAQSPGVQVANTPTEVALTDIASYVDAAALGSLSARDKAEAASAQFNALTFGRPGAPRAWSGDSGASGQVTVGPYVRVNNIDCRDFTHTVTVGGKPYAHKGMACKDPDGTWRVES